MSYTVLAQNLSQLQEEMINTSDQIWGFAELRFKEYQSSNLLMDSLQTHGFSIESNVADMDTAFIAEYGNSGPVFGFLGEFDALSGMSQKPGVIEKQVLHDMIDGHGCGHNLLGTGSLAAAVSLRYAVEKLGLPCTIRYYGCPGEEGGSGKAFLTKAGVFDDVDAAFCWHPNTFHSIFAMETLANYQVSFEFRGQSSHAAASPHLGRSALDAVELMNVGVNYLREHVIQDARLHYAITNTGGMSPNVVQDYSEVLYLIRAPENTDLHHIYERVVDIAEGAAKMTGTEVVIKMDKACSGIVRNRMLEQTMYREMVDISVPEYSSEEKQLAEAFLQTYAPEEITYNKQQIFKLLQESQLIEWQKKLDHFHPLLREVIPYNPEPKLLHGSSDVGDVSRVVPTVQCFANCYAFGATLHSWQVVSHGKTSIAHKGMLYAAEVMASTALSLLENPGILREAHEEHQQQGYREQYISPIPDGIKPSPILY